MKPSLSWFSLTDARREAKLFHITSLFPNKSLRQDRLGIYVLNTSATVSCFFLTILYSCGNWSRRDLFPSHMSSQNLTCDPSFIIKVPNLRKSHLTFIKLAQKCESPLFQWTCTNGLVPRYLLRKICCQVPSVINSRYSHLLSKATFLSSKLCISSPPWSFG